jgi:phosphoribosyl-ATP pyrophosphohydrolase
MKTIRKTISMPEKILNAGIEKAKKQDRPFSNYVKQLIERDVEAAEQAKKEETAEMSAAVG